MATFNSYANKEYVLTLTVSETGYSIEKNTSNISWTLSMRCGQWYMQHNNEYFSVTINGSTRLSGTRAAMFPAQHTSITIASGTMSDIPHNADGSLTISCSATYSPNGNTSYKPTGSMTASGTLPLTTIPRATTPTLSYSDKNHRMGTTLTINLPRASSSFTHQVSYAFGSASATISTAATTGVSWTLPKSLANQIPNALTGTGVITVVTKNGSQTIGTKTIQFSASVSDDMVPTFSSLSITRIDNEAPSWFGVYVQGISKAKLTITGASGSYGSTIKAYSIKGGGFNSSSSSAELGPFVEGTVEFSATITDSRGRTATKSIQISVVPYSTPTLTVKVERCTSDGTPDNRGTYVKVSPIYSVSSVNGQNYVTYKSFSIEGTPYTDTTCASGSSVVLGEGALLVSKTYSINASVTDVLGKTTSITVMIITSKVPFNINREGNAVCFGGYATKENTFTAYSNGKYIRFEYISNCFEINTDADFIRFAKPVMFGSKTIRFANNKDISTDNLVINE